MRTKNAVKNMKINFIFYFISILFTFILRSIFVSSLGGNIVGFNGLVNNLLGFLNIAELGVATAITYALYKPLSEKDYESINEIMALFKFYYERIGKVIFGLGIILSFLLGIFVKNQIPMAHAVVYYYLLLFNSCISYFFTYKQALIIADQKQYIITIVTNVNKILKIILQIIMLLFIKSYLLWIVLEVFFNLAGLIIISKKADMLYPNIKFIGKQNIEIIKKKNKNIIESIKNVFFHKISTFIVFQTDGILISLFLSLTQNAIYSNYMMVINNFTTLLSTVMNGMKASIGNLIAENNNKKNYEIFKQLQLIDCIIALIVSFVFYKVINSFIVIWVGEEYLFNNAIVFVLTLNLYIQITRGTVDRFKESYGIFWDVWAPIVEGSINLVVSIILINKIGVIGLFIGTFISNVVIVIMWKPYVLYRYGFNKKVHEYFSYMIYILFLQLMVLILSNYFSDYILRSITLNSNLLIKFLISAIINFIIVICITFCVFIINSEFRKLIKTRILKK